MVTPKVISAFKLENIQSWSTNSDWINFNEIGMNVFIARSETGKSVLFKVFETMCFPHKRGLRSRRGLIRRRCSEGTCYLRMSTGALITITFRPSKTLFSLQKAGETEIQHFEMSSLPKEIEEELGWIVDYDNKIILNLIDSSDGTGRLFISTTQKYNASVTRCITTEPKTTAAFNNVTEWIALLQNKIGELQPHVVKLQTCIANTPYVNEQALEVSVKTGKEILACWEPLSEAAEQLHYLEDIVAAKPEPAKGFEEATWVYNTILPVHAAQAEFEALQQIVLHKPQTEIKEVDFQTCQGILSAIQSTRYTTAGFRELIQQLQTKPPQSKFNFELATAVNSANNKLIAAHDIYNEMLRGLKDVTGERRRISELEREVKDLGNQLGKCPLCGSDITTL